MAGAGDGWLIGQGQASGVANRSRCLFCGSIAGPFAEADWLFRAAACVRCQSRPPVAGQACEPGAVVAVTVLSSHHDI
jgi:hypothetical protein